MSESLKTGLDNSEYVITADRVKPKYVSIIRGESSTKVINVKQKNEIKAEKALELIIRQKDADEDVDDGAAAAGNENGTRSRAVLKKSNIAPGSVWGFEQNTKFRCTYSAYTNYNRLLHKTNFVLNQSVQQLLDEMLDKSRYPKYLRKKNPMLRYFKAKALWNTFKKQGGVIAKDLVKNVQSTQHDVAAFFDFNTIVLKNVVWPFTLSNAVHFVTRTTKNVGSVLKTITQEGFAGVKKIFKRNFWPDTSAFRRTGWEVVKDTTKTLYGCVKPFGPHLKKLGMCFLVAAGDMLKFCFDLLLMATSIATMGWENWFPDFTVSFKLKQLLFSFEWWGFGWLSFPVLHFFSDLFDWVNISLNVGTRTACLPALLFYIMVVMFATIFTVTQVVGGDFFGILAALKYRVIVTGQQKKLRQGLKGKKGFRKKEGGKGGDEGGDEEEDDDASPDAGGRRNFPTPNKKSKEDHPPQQKKKKSACARFCSVLLAPFVFVKNLFFPPPDRITSTGVDTTETDAPSTKERAKQGFSALISFYEVYEENLKPWKDWAQTKILGYVEAALAPILKSMNTGIFFALQFLIITCGASGQVILKLLTAHQDGITQILVECNLPQEFKERQFQGSYTPGEAFTVEMLMVAVLVGGGSSGVGRI